MKNLKQYIPHLIILIAVFLTGRLTSSDSSKEVDKLREKERKLILKEIVEKQVQITRLQKDSAAVRTRMTEDSLRFAGALERNKRAYSALKKKYNEINLSRASVAELDSIVSVLYK